MANNGSGKKIRYGPDMKVLIIGGGVAGLTLAGLLQRRGFAPRLVEKAPAFGKVGYVIVIWPSGSRVDKILLTTDSSYTPTGEGPAESLRGQIR